MKIRLGVDVACRVAHQASCADEHGVMLWVGHRFGTDPDQVEALWAKLPEGATELMVVMEPTRNAWVALAAWFRRRGATVVMIPHRARRSPPGHLHPRSATERAGQERSRQALRGRARSRASMPLSQPPLNPLLTPRQDDPRGRGGVG